MIDLVYCEIDKEQNNKLSAIIADMSVSESIRVTGFINPFAFIEYFDGGGEADIILTNVVMGDINGIKLMRELQSRMPDIQIIFRSKYLEYVFDSYVVRHVAFLPMHAPQHDIQNALRIAIDNIHNARKRYLTLSCRGLISRIDLDRILYIESDIRTLHVHTQDGVLSFLRQLETVKPMLDNRFVQCHKSYILNMDCIILLDSANQLVKLTNGEVLPVSKRKMRDTRNALLSFSIQAAIY